MLKYWPSKRPLIECGTHICHTAAVIIKKGFACWVLTVSVTQRTFACISNEVERESGQKHGQEMHGPYDENSYFRPNHSSISRTFVYCVSLLGTLGESEQTNTSNWPRYIVCGTRGTWGQTVKKARQGLTQRKERPRVARTININVRIDSFQNRVVRYNY